MNVSLSAGNPTDDAHLQRCWRIQNCKDCLKKESDCSWCPFSWTCVPNSNRIQLLAPAWDKNVCPHWAERWEIRTRPLGCRVSTITTLTSLVSIASTLVFVLLVTLVVFGIRRLKGYSKKNPSWWKIWKYDWRCWNELRQQWLRMRIGDQPGTEVRESSREQEPLLPS
ncbi:uncharacterized protein F4817DRAFT_80134 [Daldinia loculata]|uniref:uncharacterized protein n=1 Tax=Daldinia loculata TaxID=103429 RepID=UPI0020C4A25E|nr:uncharacterized protein F4817DRAFT_80134 [Daldinia loculata]KAI1651733.1 hypothetical protein F4817DRAFT_80134 [Daldinia loculata]